MTDLPGMFCIVSRDVDTETIGQIVCERVSPDALARRAPDFLNVPYAIRPVDRVPVDHMAGLKSEPLADDPADDLIARRRSRSLLHA